MDAHSVELMDSRRREDSESRLASSTADREHQNQQSAVSLAPVDKGIQAWTFVASSFVLEALVWGFGFTYGIFQEWYKTNPPFNTASEATIGAIGTTALGIEYGEVIFLLLFAQRWPHLVKASMWAGLACCCLSLFASSFATEVWHLVMLQGVLYGIGGGFMYAPVIIWLSEWFVQRRGLAWGIIFGGSGVSGALFPIIINFLLGRVGGFRWTLRIWAIFIAALGSSALYFVKPRLPVAPVSRTGQAQVAPVNWSFLKSPVFLSMNLTILIQSVAYFPVSLYMPTYVASVGLSRLDGTLVLSVFNLASVIGQIAFGHFVDRTPYTRIMIFSGFSAALSAYLLWGFAHNLWVIFAFVVVFGSLSGGFCSIWPAVSADIVGAESANGALIFGCFGISRGIASVVGPIIAAALHHPQAAGLHSSDKFGGGYGFAQVTIFVGSMMLATAAGGSLVHKLRR